MKNLLSITLTAAALTTGATAALADGHSGYNAANFEVAVPASLCPETKREMARWAYGKPQYTTFAVPTARGTQECGEAGEPATAGIAQSDDVSEARRLALDVCNENRGALGRCVVIATVQLKQ